MWYSRLSELIISGGENIYPAEVEQALVSHPASKKRQWWAFVSRSVGTRVRLLILHSAKRVDYITRIDRLSNPHSLLGTNTPVAIICAKRNAAYR